MRSRQREAGFTMIELLVTLAITVVGLMGLLAAHRALAQGTSQSERAQEAAAVGTEVMESLRGTRPDMLAQKVTGGAASPPYSNPSYATILGRNGVPYDVAVEVTAVTSTLWRMRVLVEWSEDGEPTHSTAFELLRTTMEAL